VPDAPSPEPKNLPIDSSLALALLLLYAALLAVSLWAHEPWRDELHYWMSARASGGLLELWENRRFDGHPPLWSLVLFGASRISREVAMMQVSHFGIALTAAAVFVWRAPFSPRLKLLHLLGYFTLFEYGTLSRNYALGELWLWLFCMACLNRQQRTWPLALLLVLMSQSNVHIYLVGCSMMLALGMELLRQRRLPRDFPLSLALVLISVGLFLFVTRLPAGTSYPVGANLTFSLPLLCRVLACIWQAFIPIPLLQIQFHDSNLLHGLDLRWLALLSILLLVMVHRCLQGSLPKTMHGIGTALLLTFAYLKMVGFNRHSGHLYLLWLACLWIDRSQRENQQSWLRRIVPGLILAVQAVAGLIVVTLDVAFPFSTSREVVGVLRRHQAETLPVVALSDFIVAPVSAWLDRPLYYASHHRWGTFIVNDIPLDSEPPPKDILAQMRQIAGNGGQVVLVWDQALQLRQGAGFEVEELGRVAPGIVASETYFVYRFRFF